MIRFALRCDRGHEFESWFRDNASFDQQARRGFVTCPICGSASVEKAIMAPHVGRKDRDSATRGDAPDDVQIMPPSGPDAAMALLPPQTVALRAMVRRLRQRIESEAEPVGPRFAQEARRIHAGEAPERAIFGSATPDEVRDLREDGIPVAPLPRWPDDHN